MPVDFIDQLLQAELSRKDNSLALFMQMQRFKEGVANRDQQRQVRGAQLAEIEHQKGVRTSREEFYSAIAGVDPASLDDDSLFEINSRVTVLQGMEALNETEGDEIRARFPLGMTGRPEQDQFNLGIELALRGVDVELDAEQQLHVDARRKQQFGQEVAPSGEQDEAENALAEAQNEGNQRTVGEANRIGDLALENNTLDLIKQLPEGDQMGVARIHGLDKDLQKDRDFDRIQEQQEKFPGLSKQQSSEIRSLYKFKDMLDESINPLRQGDPLYDIIGGAELKLRVEEFKATFVTEEHFFGDDFADPKTGVEMTEDQVDRRVSSYRNTFKPVRQTTGQSGAREDTGGDFNSFWAPKDDDSRQIIIEAKQEMLNIQAEITQIFRMRKKRVDTAEDPNTAKAQLEADDNQVVDSSGVDIQQIGDYNDLRNSFRSAIIQEEVTVHEIMQSLADDAERMRYKALYGVTDDDLDSLMSEVSGVTE